MGRVKERATDKALSGHLLFWEAQGEPILPQNLPGGKSGFTGPKSQHGPEWGTGEQLSRTGPTGRLCVAPGP